jgi:endo-1,3-1,4-beta-glycanase ExoK
MFLSKAFEVMARDGATENYMGASTQYISGDVVSVDTYLYGKFSARVKTPNKMGTTTGFFSIYNGPDQWPNWNSIEIELVPSVANHPVSLDLSWGDGQNRQ